MPPKKGQQHQQLEQQQQQQQEQPEVPGYAVQNPTERAEYLARELAIAHQTIAKKDQTIAKLNDEKDAAVLEVQTLLRRQEDATRRQLEIQRQEARIAQQLLQDMTQKKACYHSYVLCVLSL